MSEPAKTKDAAWERVAAELVRRGKGIQWLADELGTSVQRVQNWTTRGLPGRSYADVATVLGETVDWITGLAEPKWKAAKAPPTDRDRLSRAAVAVGKTFDRMGATQKETFLKLLEAAFGASAVERPEELGHSDMMDIDLEENPQQHQRRKGDRRGTHS